MLRILGPSLLLVTTAIAQTNFPPPLAPPNNQPNADKVLLGMALFFDEQLSSTNKVACATCHKLSSAGIDPRAANSWNPGADNTYGTADDQRGSPGIALMGPNAQLIAHALRGFGEQVTHRRAPTVINSGYVTPLGYTGSKASLEDLIAVPPLNPVEMGFAGRTWQDVTQKLTSVVPLTLASNLPGRLQNFIAGRTYPDMFQLAFGTTVLSKQNVTQAIATYIRTLNSDQSKWDLHLNNQATLTAEEQLGHTLFTTPVGTAAACSSCHGDFNTTVPTTGPVAGQMSQPFTSGYFGTFGTPVRLVFHNVGLRPPTEDLGRALVTGQPEDRGSFRIASLRNVELAGPYFHNGAVSTLEDAIEFYNQGGNGHPNQASVLTPRNYTPAEKAALVAILKTLTDPRVAGGTFPFDGPTLGSETGALPSSVGAGGITGSGEMIAAVPFAAMLGESNFKVTLTGATQGTPTYLMWDTALTNSSLPLNLQLAISPSFQMFTMGPAAYQWTWSMAGSGVKIADVPIPNNSALSGQTLFAQWLALEPSSVGFAATSNAVRIPLH